MVMRSQRARLLIVAAAGLSLLAGCAASTPFDETAATDKPAQAAASSDVTGSIPMPPSARPAAPAQLPPPAAQPLIILGVAY
jgi:ABC-type uncharacterized transport system auxiliary subunit